MECFTAGYSFITLLVVSAGVLVVMTVPAFYERYEDCIDGTLAFIYNKAKELYHRFEIRSYLIKKKLS